MPPNWNFSHVTNPLNRYLNQSSSDFQGHSRRSSNILGGSLFNPFSVFVLVYPKFQLPSPRSYVHNEEEEKANPLLRESWKSIHGTGKIQAVVHSIGFNTMYLSMKATTSAIFH